MTQNQNIQADLTYVALRRLKVGSDVREPGDLVPEAAGWRNVSNYLSGGWLALVNSTTLSGATKARMGKKAGNAEFTKHQPYDASGTPASIPVDAT